MSETTDDPTGRYRPERDSDGDYDRYGSITMESGDVVIYVTDHPAAWLQSDLTVELEP